MKAKGVRGWRFHIPGFDSGSAMGFGVSIAGGIEMVEGRALIRQSILLLLATRKGERIMRPEYGCDLPRLVFLPNDETTAGLAIHYVTQAIEKWEPRVDIVQVDAKQNLDKPWLLDLFLEYNIKMMGLKETVELSMNLGGE